MFLWHYNFLTKIGWKMFPKFAENLFQGRELSTHPTPMIGTVKILLETSIFNTLTVLMNHPQRIMKTKFHDYLTLTTIEKLLTRADLNSHRRESPPPLYLLSRRIFMFNLAV